jgi:exodeoxyribonuclease-5
MNRTDIENMLLQQFPYTPTPGQEELISKLSAFLLDFKTSSIFVLKGYAGTGKTTVVSALVRILPDIHKQAVLLAPTGRAAKVLGGYSGRQAFTIHKKIYRLHASNDGGVVMTLQQNQYSDTLFIVDEASMIQNDNPNDLSLFSQRNLLDDVVFYVNQGNHCKLLLIGDTAQLPPVGLSLSPALDSAFLKAAYHSDIIEHELTEVVRQAQDSGILFNATAIRRKIGNDDTLPPFFNIVHFNDLTSISGVDFEELLNGAYSANGWGEVVVICRTNKRANIYNREIRRRVLFQENEITTGDYLMVVRNNYYWLPADAPAGFIANGDIIKILRIQKYHELYGFRFADVTVGMVDYPDSEELDVKIMLDTLHSESSSLTREENSRLFTTVMEDYADLTRRRSRIEQVRNNPFFNALQVKFAYALTCHKTQGGQWDTVFVDQGYIKDDMVNVEFLRWLYTAVTRAKQRLFLVNFEDRFFS